MRGNVVRDLAAFAKRELLPWDGWGLMADMHESDAAELALLDRVAALTLAGDERHAERLALQIHRARPARAADGRQLQPRRRRGGPRPRRGQLARAVGGRGPIHHMC